MYNIQSLLAIIFLKGIFFPKLNLIAAYIQLVVTRVMVQKQSCSRLLSDFHLNFSSCGRFTECVAVQS